MRLARRLSSAGARLSSAGARRHLSSAADWSIAGQSREGRAIYLDSQATTPMDPRVLDAMLPYMTGRYGNPHSVTHMYGWETEDAVEDARACRRTRRWRRGRSAAVCCAGAAALALKPPAEVTPTCDG